MALDDTEDAVAFAASAAVPSAPQGAIEMARKGSFPSRMALNRTWAFLKDLGHTPTALDVLQDGAVRLHLREMSVTVPASNDQELDDELTRFREQNGYR